MCAYSPNELQKYFCSKKSHEGLNNTKAQYWKFFNAKCSKEADFGGWNWVNYVKPLNNHKFSIKWW